MNPLTIRGFDKDIEREIREVAAKEKVSLNKAVHRILQRGLGSTDRHARRKTIGSAHVEHFPVLYQLRNPEPV